MKTIVVLMDSLNRRCLSMYGGNWAFTPNMERLAAKSCIFDNHFVGSAPCMPARHDFLTGRLDFLERNWAPVQPFDCTLPSVLQQHDVFTHMVTDHYHYFHLGGENYYPLFSSWEFIRGQEHDTMVSNLGTPIQKPHIGNYDEQYERNRTVFYTEADYPSPKTLQHAAEWVEQHCSDDQWMLFVDSFDPHEPFDFPDDISIDDDYQEDLFYWPLYDNIDSLPEGAVEHAKKRYAKVVEMSDRWLGRLLDVLDKHDMWDDTMVVLTTDHGYMFGEKNVIGKNFMPCYNEIYQIPMMIHLPHGPEGTRCDALTQNIDLFPTILEVHDIPESACRYPLHGHSLIPLLTGASEKVRDSVIYGMFGRHVNICDGRYTYFRAAVREDNQPLYVYTAMPSTIGHYWDHAHVSDMSQITAGQFLSYTDYPVFRIPNTIVNMQDFSHAFDKRYEAVNQNMLFDLQTDPRQEHPLCDERIEEEMCDKLRQAMRLHDGPSEQFIRLGL
ncbi:MAG: sulfatase [Agathobaculum desmolans]|uniref:sulfatase n=1 Tax=Agathobaculum desmolans TaxID=39484 RepID=UPI003993D256